MGVGGAAEGEGLTDHHGSGGSSERVPLYLSEVSTVKDPFCYQIRH